MDGDGEGSIEKGFAGAPPGIPVNIFSALRVVVAWHFWSVAFGSGRSCIDNLGRYFSDQPVRHKCPQAMAVGEWHTENTSKPRSFGPPVEGRDQSVSAPVCRLPVLS